LEGILDLSSGCKFLFCGGEHCRTASFLQKKPRVSKGDRLPYTYFISTQLGRPLLVRIDSRRFREYGLR
jgi:hypothetical protein